MSPNPTSTATHPSLALGLAIAGPIVEETVVDAAVVPVVAADVVVVRAAAVVVATAAQGTRTNQQITGAAMKIAAS
jgi:Tfp pilus assembly major pilin PilA